MATTEGDFPLLTDMLLFRMFYGNTLSLLTCPETHRGVVETSKVVETILHLCHLFLRFFITPTALDAAFGSIPFAEIQNTKED